MSSGVWISVATHRSAPLARWFPELPKAKGALLCVATELHTPELIELFAKSVRG